MLFTVKELVWTVAGSMGGVEMKSVGWKSIVLPQSFGVPPNGVDVGLGVGVGVPMVQTSVIGW